ncbi:hypothetical protein T4C_386, partial [Trichinella pseudospiralis]
LKTNGRTSSPGNLLFIFQASLQQIHYYIANIILKNEASIEEFFGSLFFYHINMTLRLGMKFYIFAGFFLKYIFFLHYTLRCIHNAMH